MGILFAPGFWFVVIAIIYFTYKARKKSNSDAKICTNCLSLNSYSIKSKGSMILEFGLWCCFLFPGFIYSWWRTFNKYEKCDNCGGENHVSIYTPKGILLEKDRKAALSGAI